MLCYVMLCMYVFIYIYVYIFIMGYLLNNIMGYRCVYVCLQLGDLCAQLSNCCFNGENDESSELFGDSFFVPHFQTTHGKQVYLLEWKWKTYKKRWKITMLLMGKSTISMVIFNSYV